MRKHLATGMTLKIVTRWGRVAPALLLALVAGPASAQGLAPAGPDQLAFSVENMEPSVSPAQDFYTYGAGAWLKRVERPERHGGYGFFDRFLKL